MIIVAEPSIDAVLLRSFGTSYTSTLEWKPEQDTDVGTTEQLRNVIRRLADGQPVEAVSFHLRFGGDTYKGPVRVTEEFTGQLARRAGDFPLFIPFACAALSLFLEALKDVPQFAFFETSFFSGLPASETNYPIAEKYYRDSSVAKQGYHGIFHGYHAKLLSKNEKIISVVLDRRTTVCAINKGVPAAVSLGYSPLEGIMSAKSCGDIDPGIAIYLMKERGLSMYKVDELLKHKSGFYGMTGYDLSPDELITLYGKDDKVAMAFDVYRNQILKYVGDYIALLRGMDALVFAGCYAGKMGQVIYQIAKDLSFLEVNLDGMPWEKGKDLLRITSDLSKRHVFINTLDETDIIFRETRKGLRNLRCRSN